MARQLVQQAGSPNILQAAENLGFNTVRGASNIARNLGAGAIPDIAGTGYLAGQEALSGINPLDSKATPQQLQNLYKSNPYMSAQTAQQTGGLANAGQDLAGSAGWLAGGLGGAAAPWLARAGTGALSGGLIGASQKKGNLGTNIGLGAASGAVGNVVLPPILQGAGKFLGNAVFGKAGEDIPAIAGETGQTITGLGSQGAKAAQQDIGQSIEDIYKQAATSPTGEGMFATDTSLNPGEIKNLIGDVGERTPIGIGNSPMSEIMNRYNIVDPKDMSAAADYLNPSARMISKTTTNRASQTLGGDFVQSLNDYIEKLPPDEKTNMMQYIQSGGGMENIDKMDLPTDFWHRFAADLNSKVPYDQVTDARTGMADYSKLGGVQNMQRAVANIIKENVRGKIAAWDPNAATDLQRLNGLYGSASDIASGRAKGLLSPEFLTRASLMGAGVSGAAAAGTGNTKVSPYFQALTILALLANPRMAGSIASGTGLPITQSLIPAISSLVGSSGVKSMLGQTQQ